MSFSTCTAIIVNYNTAHLLAEMFACLKQADGGRVAKTVVVDNASRDDSLAVLARDFPSVDLISNRTNVGFGRANNQALPMLEGDYVLLLNTDAFVAPDTLEKTLAYMEAHPRCGILGVRLVGRDGTLQPSARYFPTPWNLFLQRSGLQRFFPRVQMVDDMAWDHASVRHCDWVPGCYYLVRRAVIAQVGLFDPRYFLYYEEVDHCFAAKRAGWDVVYYPDTSVVHIGGESAKSEGEITTAGRQLESLQIESELLYFRKNHGRAGVWGQVLLTTLADFFQATKALLRGRFSRLGQPLRHAGKVWRLFRQTRFGTQATR